MKPKYALDWRSLETGPTKHCTFLNLTMQIKFLERFGMDKAKPAVTPMEGQLGGHDDNNLAEDVPYQQVIGSLMYLTVGTRPDIAFAVGRVCKSADCPTWEHWTAAKPVPRYIAGTKAMGTTERTMTLLLSPTVTLTTQVALSVASPRAASVSILQGEL